jgi:prolyl-tRNA synthetase
LVVDVGPRDLDSGRLTVTARTRSDAETIARDEAAITLGRLLDQVQANLLSDAARFRDDVTTTVATRRELEQACARGGLVHTGWCGDDGCEAEVKAATTATIRCLPLTLDRPSVERCGWCARAALEQAIWARAY